MKNSQKTGAGVYIHVPFCERLCPYCDFAVSVKVDIPHEEYSAAVIGELRRRQDELAGRSVQTIYFGGGTPSLLSVSALERLIDEVHRLFDVDDDVEVTMEANPNQVHGERLKAWASIGINRLSIGCQSFQDRHLKALRRNHDGAHARRAVEAALEVMGRVSMDLMFAGPSQTMEEWEADLVAMQQLVRDFGLDHVSAYNLTIEPGTAFWIRRKRGTVVVPGEDVAAAMLGRLVEATGEVGLRRYEVSNFAAAGGESRHNGSYWKGVPYLGAGVGAHSLQLLGSGAAKRRSNPKRYDDYMKSPGEPADVEELSAVEHLRERLFLGARSTFGVDLGVLKEAFPGVADEVWPGIEAVLDDLVARGWMAGNTDGVYGPTNRGLDFSDSLAAWLFEAL